MDRADATERLARLAVSLGANVRPDQLVAVDCDLGHEPLARAVAAAAYRRGARFVDVRYFDPHVKRARIEHADEATLDYVPPWYAARLLAVAEEHGARVSIVGATAPGALDGLDPRRAGRDHLPRLKESIELVNGRRATWTVVPCPTRAWARLVHRAAGADEALELLWREIVHVCRLDEPDPVAAWTRRLAATATVARRLTDARLDTLRFEGPGTDLTVGLLPTSRFANVEVSTVDGVTHVANIPSEEVASSPDPERTEGVVRATRPLVLADGTVIEGLRVRFRRGRAVEIDADTGAATLRARTAVDEGAARLGEVALVDRDGRIGELGTVFYETLLDENAASHVALGSAYEHLVAPEDHGRLNRSSLHLDFMIGSDDVAVTGVTASGERVPLLRGGAWQL